MTHGRGETERTQTKAALINDYLCEMIVVTLVFPQQQTRRFLSRQWLHCECLLAQSFESVPNARSLSSPLVSQPREGEVAEASTNNVDDLIHFLAKEM